MKKLSYFVAVGSIVTTTTSFCFADTIDTKKFIEGMKNVGDVWISLANSGEVFTWECAEKTFAAKKISIGTSISVDVRQTNSIMNPYVGIVFISGRSVTNATSQFANGFLDEYSNPQRFVCFKTPDESLEHLEETDFAGDRSYEHSFEAYYVMEGERMILQGGNTVFQNSFITSFQNAIMEPDSPWRSVLSLEAR